ncbi:MAG: hypothetical protein Greene101449_1200, partial [Candidatus Peregrinibacteria bacterium Greene1014_49]
MNYRSIFIIGSILLSACTPQRSGMGMNHGMMRGDNTVDAGGTSVLLSEKDIDL